MSVSRDSTVTLGRGDAVHGQESRYQTHFVHDASIPYSMSRGIEETLGNRLIIAVDFGTTYSAVSYVPILQGQSLDLVEATSIHSIKNYPDSLNFISNDQMVVEVPTEVSYPSNKNFRDEEAQSPTNQNLLGEELDKSPNNHAMDLVSESSGQFDVAGDFQMLDSVLNDQFRWGYGVHGLLSLPSTHSDGANQPMSRIKLLLDSSPVTKTLREQVQRTVSKLKKQKIVGQHADVIADFLTYLLKHTEKELQAKGFDHTFQREIVLCVPAIWTQQACRQMQTCMATAMQRAHFKGVDIENNSIDNLFIVSEPEAAAAYVLTDARGLNCGDVFVLLDAGGGTVDANTYEISEKLPLRLSREVVAPGGGLYGSSFINEKFCEYLKRRLASETYFEQGEETISGIAEAITIDQFEYRVKRSFDLYTAPEAPKSFPCYGLRHDPSKGFFRGSIIVPARDIRRMFLECLEGVSSIMEAQINAAKERGFKVKKIVLIGGFASSISLQKFLQSRINKINERDSSRIDLVSPRNNTANAVASGAVLRALNKERGPERIARSSYGIMRTEHFGAYDEHKGEKPSYDRHDGQPYIAKTIDWVLKLGQNVDPVWECRPFPSSHTFDVSPVDPLLCREILYVSDTATRSHFRLSHKNNEGAEQVGEIVVDATFLRDQNKLTIFQPVVNKNGRKVGTRHYRVNYDIVIRVVDRDLECHAIFDGTIYKKCRINIASAFLPGVK